MLTQPQLQRCLRAAVSSARQAGTLLLKHAGAPRTVETKRSVIDLVTDIDRAAEQLIHRTLQRAHPDFGFLGEERGNRRPDTATRWIVDPIDGTMNFVHGVPLFGISIGLQHQGRIVLGVIHDPSRRELYTAIAGGGAFVNGRRLRVARTKRLAQSLLSTGFSSTFRKNPQPYLNWFRALESRSHAVRRIGTTVLSLAYVAAGRLEGFYERDLWPWDVAAGLLMVQEAGGRVSDLAGRPPVVGSGQLQMVATNGRIHQELLTTLRRFGA